MAIQDIKAMISIAVPVRHGRWIPDTAFGNDVMGYAVICSVCGQGHFQGNIKYCPICGAKMDLEEEKDD